MEENVYNRLREHLSETIESWVDICDEDVLESQKDIYSNIKKCDTFKLYRYMPPDYYNIRNIEIQKIHLSPNGVMNDVFEGLPESFDEISYDKLRQLKDLAYMTCMTEDNNNLLMWSHYAKNHEGFCVEYDIKKLHNPRFNLDNHLFPIVYRDKRLSKRDYLRLAESHEALNKAISNNYYYDGDETLDDILPIFLVKDKVWEYEKEWRIIFTKKQMYDENDKELYGGNVKFNCISAVYLGYRIHPEIRDNILEICNRISTDKNKIDVYKSKLHHEKYSIEFERIN